MLTAEQRARAHAAEVEGIASEAEVIAAFERLSGWRDDPEAEALLERVNRELVLLAFRSAPGPLEIVCALEREEQV